MSVSSSPYRNIYSEKPDDSRSSPLSTLKYDEKVMTAGPIGFILEKNDVDINIERRPRNMLFRKPNKPLIRRQQTDMRDLHTPVLNKLKSTPNLPRARTQQ